MINKVLIITPVCDIIIQSLIKSFADVQRIEYKALYKIGEK